jgi:hypothetical protein
VQKTVLGNGSVSAACTYGVEDGDASTDASADAGADACAPSVCTESCVSGAHNVSALVDGCVVSQCCVPDDAGADAARDGGPADASGE